MLTTSGAICTGFVSVMAEPLATIRMGETDSPRGARVIELQEGVRHFETWLHLDNGTTVREQPEHTPLQRTFTED